MRRPHADAAGLRRYDDDYDANDGDGRDDHGRDGDGAARDRPRARGHGHDELHDHSRPAADEDSAATAGAAREDDCGGADPRRQRRRRPPRDRRDYGTPTLSGGPYVFPVLAKASFGDSWGAARADVGWHRGVDIFAPLGAPVVAVADGVLLSVGWNDDRRPAALAARPRGQLLLLRAPLALRRDRAPTERACAPER